jgi:competence protein ComEA
MNLLKRLLCSFLLIGVVSFANAAVDINTADKTVLGTLKGIGPAKAEAIIKYRQEKGSFKTVDELKNVNGIGDKIFEAIKSDITVGDDPAVKPPTEKPADKASAKAEEKKPAEKPAEKPADKAPAKAEEKKPAEKPADKTPAPSKM